MTRFMPFVLVAALLSGCARTSSMQLAADTVQISAGVAPVCGQQGAERMAAKAAAVETIKHGFDKYIILGSRGQNNVGVVGYTPMTAHTTYGGGVASTTVYGGQPIVAGSHDRGLVVKMFRDGDPNGDNAILATATLGPKWREIVQQPTLTCLD